MRWCTRWSRHYMRQSDSMLIGNFHLQCTSCAIDHSLIYYRRSWPLLWHRLSWSSFLCIGDVLQIRRVNSELALSTASIIKIPFLKYLSIISINRSNCLRLIRNKFQLELVNVLEFHPWSELLQKNHYKSLYKKAWWNIDTIELISCVIALFLILIEISVSVLLI